MEIVGQVEKISYQSPDQTFFVVRVKRTEDGSLITAVGPLPGVSVGEYVRMVGKWETHPRYGLRFKVEIYTPEAPTLPEAMEKYLGSGLIKGVGPATAKKIVDHFREKTFQVIEESPQELLKVKGVTKKKLRDIIDSLDAHKGLRNLLLFMKGFDLPTGLSLRIYRRYKEAALSVLKEDPYRLAMEVPGIGFLTADNIAQKMGYPKDSPNRMKAGILYTLSKKVEEGHTYYPTGALLEEASKVLGADLETLTPALEGLFTQGLVLERELDGGHERGIYLEELYKAEAYVGRRIRLLIDMERRAPLLKGPVKLSSVEDISGIKGFRLNQEQVQAIGDVLGSRMVIITGGPGTGKTTIIKAIVGILKEARLKVTMAAPTGRAARRMGELAGEEAKTIHRLLGWNPETGTFIHNEKNPLNCHTLIVDESSMVDIVLMSHLLRALPQTSRIVLVGDKDQLPPVGPGSPFMELSQYRGVKVIRLNTIYRQDSEGLLVLNAHRINQGLFPVFMEREDSDFYFIEEADPQKAYGLVIELATRKLPHSFGLDPMESIQVLSPTRKGVLGIENLVSGIQDELNPLRDQKKAIFYQGKHTQRSLRTGDKVMQIRNDYEKDVYNGDMGRIKAIDLEEASLCVSFDGRDVRYDMMELDDLTLAYCISVHKSQGSEYPAVVLTLTTQHYPLLQRNLLYTAITRAKRLAVIVGTKKAMAMAIKNNKPFQRFSGLSSWLPP